MAEDLGTWPPEQATVLLETLQQAGLTPKAKRTRNGVVVTVPDEQTEDAHRTLVANMDSIASAARPSSSRRSPKHPRKATGSRSQAPSRPTSRSGGSARMSSVTVPLGILIIGLIVATVAHTFVPGLRAPILVVTLGAIIYALGKQAQARGG